MDKIQLMMPSILNCFCVKHGRRSLVPRKRGSRKKILNSNSDWNSDTSSDLFVKPDNQALHAYRPTKFTQFGHSMEKQQDAEILSRLMDNQSPRRRRHVEDIFRQGSPAESSRPYMYRSTGRGTCIESVESMYGYVPKAVGAMSASTALTGVKYDDFFSDQGMHPDLNKFAKSTDFNSPYNEFYAVGLNRNENKQPSVINMGTSDGLYVAAPAHVQLEMEHEDTRFDDVKAGSVSSASSSPVSSADDHLSREPVQHSFLIGHDTTTSSHSITPYDKRFENLFQSDGDILY